MRKRAIRKSPMKLLPLACGLGLGLAGTLSAGTLQEGLVVHLPFDGDLTDKAGNVVPRVAGAAAPSAAGKVGSGSLKVWSYKNADDAATAGDEQFNFLTLADPSDTSVDPNDVLNVATDVDFSVAFWVKLDTWSGDPSFFSNKNWGSGGNLGYVLATDTDGHFQWNYKENVTGRRDYDGSAGALSQGWHHIAVTFKRSGNATTYIDGLQVDSRGIAYLDDTHTWVPGDLTSGLLTNLGQDGTGSYTDGNKVWWLNTQIDDFGFWRRELAASEVGRIFTAGQAGLDLSAVPDPTTPAITLISPADGSLNFSPAGAFQARIEDGGTALNPATLRLELDGVAVTPTITAAAAGVTLVDYTPASLLPRNSQHTYKLQFSDKGSPVVTKSQTVGFSIGDYKNIYLPDPLYFEDFNGVSEVADDVGILPAGWTVKNYTSTDKPGYDIHNPSSDSYKDWVIVSLDTFSSTFDHRRLNVQPWQVVNGKVLTTLITGNLCYAESDNRGGSQYQILYSPDFDCSGKQNIYLKWNSIYEQNQDSFGSVEYSIDEGATWQPVIYMIDTVTKDIQYDADNNIDPVATFSRVDPDGTAKYSDPDTGATGSGNYGSFIGVTEDRWSDLAPYISGRVNDNASESKRVEVYRLPLADNQAKVRLRFAQAGTGSWYYGIDDVGLYSIPDPKVSLTHNAQQVTLSFEGGWLQVASNPEGPWSDVLTAKSPLALNAADTHKFYRVYRPEVTR